MSSMRCGQTTLTRSKTHLVFLLLPDVSRERQARRHLVLSHIHPLRMREADEQPARLLDVRRPRIPRAVARKEQARMARFRRCVGGELRGEVHPVVEPVPLEPVRMRLDERPAAASAVEAAYVLAVEPDFRDLLRERDWVSVVDTLPSERIEEELIAQE